MGQPTQELRLTLRRAGRFDRDCVALCFKVPFEFRQWLKLQALQRNLTMTELLVKALESYVEAAAPAASVAIATQAERQKSRSAEIQK